MALIIRVLIDDYFSSVKCESGTVRPYEKPEWGTVESIYKKQAEARGNRLKRVPGFK